MKIEEFLNGVKDIQDKNAGGCLFICLAFYRWLKKNNLPTEGFEIVQYDAFGARNIEHNLAFISGDKDKAQSSAHFTWIYNDDEYDGEGLRSGKWDLSSSRIKRT